MPEILWFQKVFDTKKCVKLIFWIEIGQNMELCFGISNKSFSCQTPKFPKRKPQTHPEQAAKNRQLMLHSSRSGQEEAGKDSAWASQDTGPWTCEQMDNGTPEMNRITSPSLPAVSVVVRQIRRCCDTGASPAPPMIYWPGPSVVGLAWTHSPPPPAYGQTTKLPYQLLILHSSQPYSKSRLFWFLS